MRKSLKEIKLRLFEGVTLKAWLFEATRIARLSMSIDGLVRSGCVERTDRNEPSSERFQTATSCGVSTPLSVLVRPEQDATVKRLGPVTMAIIMSPTSSCTVEVV